MSIIVLSSSCPVARKDYSCDSWEWLSNAWPLGDFLSFTEMRKVVKAKRNSYKIKKGDRYFKQTGLYDGEFYTFRAIPDLNEICMKHDIYDE
jgi:hypothetical protein